MSGLIHIYCGDGKGKTTCSMGLAVRCAGAGGKVTVVQFLKSGNSSELSSLEKLEGITVVPGSQPKKFVFQMNEEEKERCRLECGQLLEKAFEQAVDCRMLVLDEICAAVTLEMVDKHRLVQLIENRPDGLEIVMTGRDPEPELVELADYISEIRKIKHPYDKGVQSRKGIEF